MVRHERWAELRAEYARANPLMARRRVCLVRGRFRVPFEGYKRGRRSSLPGDDEHMGVFDGLPPELRLLALRRLAEAQASRPLGNDRMRRRPAAGEELAALLLVLEAGETRELVWQASSPKWRCRINLVALGPPVDLRTIHKRCRHAALVKYLGRLAGIASAVRGGRVGNRRWAHHMLAKRGGQALARHAPRILEMGRECLAARRTYERSSQLSEESKTLSGICPVRWTSRWPRGVVNVASHPTRPAFHFTVPLRMTGAERY